MGNCMNPKQENSQVGDLNAMTGKDLKLLLLGAGESGKSTIYKQIRILKNKNYDKEDLEQFATAIKTNVIISIKALVEACSTLKIEIKTQENKDFAEKIKKWEEDNYGNIIKDFDETYAEKLSNLWEDIGIQSALEHRSKYQLLDSTEYFFENLKKICSREYIPSNEDILRCRVKTIGIVNVEFQEADIKYKIFDVGGQRNERRKWIHCFDNVNAIIFVVSLNEYDLTCYEDGTTPRMDESLSLFENICENKAFIDIPIVLFFNKNDLFQQKIQKIDLSVWDKDYEGGCDYDKALKHIRDRFLKLNTIPDRRIEVFVCTSTEAKNFSQVFDQVKGTALELLVDSQRK